MGVQGWNLLLTEHGWLPFVDLSQAASTSAFLSSEEELLEQSNRSSKAASSTHVPFDRIQAIPSNAELHLDGVCVCFQIHSVAYARHRQQVLGGNNSSSNSRRTKTTTANHLTAAQIRHLMPCFLPTDLLTQVTLEFLETLLQENRNVKVYWDGDLRYAPPVLTDKDENDSTATDPAPMFFKQDTELSRQSKRQDEWSNLQRYCEQGRLPSAQEWPLVQWERAFPKTRLFISQVMAAMVGNQNNRFEMIFCQEEADALMAKSVSGNTNAYIVGLDSDFCFFPDVNYIPIHTLIHDEYDKQLKAIILRRDTIAASLELPHERLMVELAMLMGNDYVSQDDEIASRALGMDVAKKMQKGKLMSKTKAAIAFLKQQSEDFQLECNNHPQLQACMDFCRNVYNLQDMSEYAMEEAVSGEAENGLIPLVHESLREELKEAVVDIELDDSLQDAVIRYVEKIAENAGRIVDQNQEADDTPTLDFTSEQLETFRQVVACRTAPDATPPTPVMIDQDIIRDDKWRPAWEDVAAAYWIERIISKVYANTLEQQGVAINHLKLDAPGNIFDSYLFYAMMRVARNKLQPAVTEKPPAMEEEPRLKLPVDEFESTILESVRKNRVTIIQGETGCGKSSRIPVMLLNADPPESSFAGQRTKLFISQPRRIAAKALVERLRSTEPVLRDQIALRMGHGVREYETKQTRAWFVTTGYLVRLLANHPEKFENISYLVIDEVHERSVDTDILCLLCKRLLINNQRIRLVLMSATLAAALYQDYFGVPEPPIKVGARRFRVEEVFLEDMIMNKRLLPVKERKQTEKLLEECRDMRCKRPPSMQYMEKLYSVSASLATGVGKPGTSVLIFVPGMNDIVAITELVESINVVGVTYTCFPIHSDIPFEDQMHVFELAKPDEVKIVIATNAAESSVTLPDVDNVICLGLCKQIVYNEASHRQMLLPTWISRASATQRAGRTGRVRPGTVYRLYSQSTFETNFEAFEPGELLRTPLDSVILQLKEMLTDEAATEVLLDCLEPPDIATIDRSFVSLHRSHFITTPDDLCEITTLGAFVTALGIDLALGSLIGLGIQMGVGAEAIEMAAILSFPKTPWVMSNPLIHPTKDFNEQTKKTFVSRCHFDANLFSEPLAIMNLVWHYDRVSKSEAQKWCKYYGIFLPRIKRLSASIDNLRKRVADFIGVHEALLKVEVPPSQMPHGKVTILRVIQVWVFHETLIQYDPERLQKAYDKKGVSLQLTEKSDQMERNHLDQVLMKDRHPFELCGSSTIQLNGTFELLASSTGKKSGANRDFLSKLEARALSYATEKGFDSVCIAFADILVVYACPGLEAERLLLEAMRGIGQEINTTTLEAKLVSGKARRGISERACGMWKVEASFEKKSNDDSETTRTWSRSSARSDKKGSLKPKDAKRQRVNIDKVLRSNSFKSVSLFLPWSSTSIQTDQSLKFELIIFNAINAMNNVDLRDLLGPGVQTSKAPRKTVGKQTIKFPLCDNSPYYYKGKAVNTGDNISNLNGVPKDSSWERPLLKCIPEGARLLSVLASSRRKEQVVKFLPEIKDNSNDNSGKEGKQKGETGKAEDDDDDLCFYLDKSANIAFRWKRFNSEDTVYVETNSVPASAVPHRGLGMMYSVCANTLELRGGSLRAEGLTLLPQGRQFLLLSRFTFGLFQQSNFADGTIYKKAVAWADPSADAMTKKLIKDRVEKAVRFHQSSLNLGEALECFPEKVVELLDIFNLVDSYRSKAWDSLDSNPFIRENLIRHKVDLEKRHPVRFYRQESSGVDGGGSSSDDGDRELERVLAATSHLDLETGTGHTSKKGEKKTNKKDKKKKEKDNNHHDKKKAKKGKSKENSKVDAKDKKAKDKKKKKEKS